MHSSATRPASKEPDGNLVADFVESVLGLALPPWQRQWLVHVYDQPGRRGATRGVSPRLDHP